MAAVDFRRTSRLQDGLSASHSPPSLSAGTRLQPLPFPQRRLLADPACWRRWLEKLHTLQRRSRPSAGRGLPPIIATLPSGRPATAKRPQPSCSPRHGVARRAAAIDLHQPPSRRSAAALAAPAQRAACRQQRKNHPSSSWTRDGNLVFSHTTMNGLYGFGPLGAAPASPQ